MAYLNKKQYEYRRESAANRCFSNEEIAVQHGMSEAQAENISELCSLRHEMHCNISHLVEDNSYNKISETLILLNGEIKMSGLPYIETIPTDRYDYIDIDDMFLIYETVQLPDDDEEREDYLATQREIIYSEWENLNNAIEKYLADIDKKYGTSWCPSGALRKF